MLPSFFRLPDSVSLCFATLCAGLVLLLQYAPSCAQWAEERELNTCAPIQASVDFLRRVSETVHFPALNRAETALADSASDTLAFTFAEYAPRTLSTDLPELSPSLPENTTTQEPPPEPRNASDTPPAEGPVLPSPAAQPVLPQPAAPTVPHGTPTPEPSLSIINQKSTGTSLLLRAHSPRTSLFDFADGKISLNGKHIIFNQRSTTENPGSIPLPSPTPSCNLPLPSLPDLAAEIVRRDGSDTILNRESAINNQIRASEGDARASGGTWQDCGPMRCRILMVGDSLMEDLGPMTHRAMRQRKGLEFIVSAKFSTGLCRPSYFNWPEHLTDVVERYHPDIVVFFLGANDGVSVRVGKRAVPTGGEAWQAAYGAKMEEVLNIVRQDGADVIWVELPAIGGKYSKVLRETQLAQCTYCDNNGIPILHSDLALSGEWGIFAPYGDFNGSRTRLRRQDLVHLTKEGNQKLLGLLMPLLEQHLYAFYVSHPERHLSPEEVKQIRNVPAVYTCQPGYSRSEKPESPQ